MSGRAVLVTGSSRGIGRAVAQAFAAAGDRVAVHHRDSGDAAADAFASLPGEGHAVVQADMADPEAVQQAVDGAAEALGGLDVLVNNAAVFGECRIADVSYGEWQEHWRRLLDVNLLGAANATWCAVTHMRAGGGGRIVNVSSRGAFRGEPDNPPYGASKAGLNSLTGSLAQALAPYGIAVAAVAPGFVDTDMTNAHLKSPRGDAVRAQSPFERVARPGEIASAVLYLASPEAEWASGTVLDLNGASYLRT